MRASVNPHDILNAMRLSLKRGGGSTVAIADIGSGSVALVVLEVNPGKPGTILAAERSVLPIEERTPGATITAIVSELGTVAKRVLAAYTAKFPKKSYPPSELFCIVRAPWTHSQTVFDGVRFEKETRITSELISKIAKAALGKATAIDRANFFEASVVQVEVNGYPTASPEGKYASEIAVTALANDCNPDIRAGIERAVETILPHATHVWRSGTRALLRLLRERSKQKDYFVIDVASEGTNLVVVRDNAPAEQNFINEGVRTILRRVAPSGMPEETLTLLRMIAEDQCSNPACEAVQASMARVEPELVKLFGEAMAKCAAVRRIPGTLVLVVHPDLAHWLASFFSRIDFTQFTQTTQPFTVETIGTNDMKRWVVPEHGVVLDGGLAIASAFVNIEKNEQ
jgi:hypothetical protein